jgi:DNA mismatch repair protein MutS
MIPPEYIRKQTLTNCERYVTSELKEAEERILGAKDKLVELEHKILEEIRQKVSNEVRRVEKTTDALALLDVILSFASAAVQNNYVRPTVNNSKKIILKECRHPVVEILLEGAPFVPNDVLLDDTDNIAAVITGPNMAGKSTYMRQVALISLMAQMGGYVPAASAETGIVDSIFTRIGASDDLASGQSTFMVEMNEVAYIIDNATPNSLIILDEIGRGTSTFDGMSIAKAVLEYVTDKQKLGSKTLFATHYHELTSMSKAHSGIKNYNTAVRKKGDDITFLRKIVPGGADDSYGIEVAKLSGMPAWVINRAKEVLIELEGGKKGILNRGGDMVQKTCLTKEPNPESAAWEKILNRIKSLEISAMTPIEAMNVLDGLVSECREKAH